jgi:hypothetical protein
MATGSRNPAVVFRVTVSTIAIVLACLVASGCAWSGDDGNGVVGGGDDASSTESSGPAPSEARTERNASVYAAVIRRLVTKDHTFGGGDPGFRVLFVVNGAVPRVANLNGARLRNPKRPFSEELKRRLETELSDLPPLRFVRTRGEAIRGESSSSPGQVIPGGVLITLGPIVGGPSRVRVGNSLWLSGLAGQWLTYVVTRRADVWRVKGTTGPTAIS